MITGCSLVKKTPNHGKVRGFEKQIGKGQSISIRGTINNRKK